MKQQVCEVEEGSLETLRRTCQNVSTIIQSCPNGPCTSRYQYVQVGGTMIMYSIGKRRDPSKFQRVIDRTTRSLPHDRPGNGFPLWAYVVCN